MGPNHYQLWQITRGTPAATLRKLHLNMSLASHPDKMNNDPAARDHFVRFTGAYEVLKDREMRSVYDRLGDDGAKLSRKKVLDCNFILREVIFVPYLCRLGFVVLTTFSEPSGDTLEKCMLGLAIVLLFEALLVLEEKEIPVWLFPCNTSHEVVYLMHRLFFAYMNGYQCFVAAAALRVDDRAVRIAELKREQTLNNSIMMTMWSAMCIWKFRDEENGRGGMRKSAHEANDIFRNSIIQDERDVITDEARVLNSVVEQASLVQDENRLRAKYAACEYDSNSSRLFVLFRSLVIFIVASCVFRKR